jgi:hypothetical protein
MNIFEDGQLYFMVTYPDVDMAYPEIKSFIYLGKNISDEDEEDSWYFQPCDDYVSNGSALNPGPEIREAICITKETIEAMLDDEKLFDEIKNASQRRRRKKNRHV